jgi:hypothetical protein
VGAPQVFVTLRDNLEGEYASEGLEHIDQEADNAVTRRASFAAVQQLVANWGQLMAWRGEQRENEREQRVQQAAATLSATEARAARPKFTEARLRVHSAQDDLARPRLSERKRARLAQRLARARALLAGRRTLLLWHSSHARWHRERAYERGVAVALLQQRIANGG